MSILSIIYTDYLLIIIDLRVCSVVTKQPAEVVLDLVENIR